MINKIKTLAIAMLAAGATATAPRALAAPAPDTNTFTNVVQNLSITLTVYSNAAVLSSTKIGAEKPVSVTTKTILAALSNAAPTIPSLVGFDWGKSPKLVLNTTFTASNTPTFTTNVVTSNTVTISTTNAQHIAFVDGTTNVVTIATNGSLTITNNAVGTNGGTNVATVTGGFAESIGTVSTNAFSYTNASGTVTNGATFGTNVGEWTVVTAVAETNGTTNVTTITYTNTPATNITYITNSQGVEVQGGTAAAPAFANVSSYLTEGGYASVYIAATGSNLTDIDTTNSTNVVFTYKTNDAFGGYFIHLFNTNASTSPANNLSLSLYGFVASASRIDVLAKNKKDGFTNQVYDTTSSAKVSGYGYVGGTYVTNAVAGGTNSIGLYATEYYGTNTAFTNEVTGSITNPIPVVVEGTVSIGGPSSVPQ